MSVPAPNTALGRMAERNPDLARRVRANLAVYARRSGDPEVRDRVADVLAGRRELGVVTESEHFNDTVTGHLDNLLAGIEELEPEQREQAFDRTREPTPDSELIALRDEAAPSDGWAAEDAAPAGGAHSADSADSADRLLDRHIRAENSRDDIATDRGGWIR